MQSNGFGKSNFRAEHHAIKDHRAERNIFRRRMVFMLLFVIVLFSALIYRFYKLQISLHQDYATQSDRNRIQVRPVEPNRGLIYDALGNVLAENRTVNSLTIIKERAGDIDKTIERLSKLISISDLEKKSFYKALRWRIRPYQAVPLKLNLSDDELAILAVNEYLFDGLEVQGRLVRHYPHKHLFSHSVGYVGRVSEAEIKNFTAEQVKHYSGVQSIGKIGLEKYYESLLSGVLGQESIETDARGRILRVLDTELPEAGKDLHLSMRLDLQSKAYDEMAGRRGTVVALDIETGGVLAMLSSPSFDPNLFVLGISGKDYNALNTSKDLPMFNRAIQGQYPPGSTLKPMLGLGGLESGAITTETTVNDPGYYQLENDDRLYRDWLRTGHGHKVDLFQAIVQSCDVFFYGLGNKMGVDRMHPFGLPFGLGARTNIDIPSERKGLWPSREWKKKVRNLAWYPGNSLNMSLGQGDVLATPLQLALMTSTLARKGTLIEPRLVEKIDGEQVPRVVRNEYQPTEEHWQYVINAMTAVVHSSRGTARSIAKKINYKMAGKTGTAQLVSIAQGEKYDSDALSERNRDNALFVAFAPAENPKIAVSVMIENAERSSHAVKVATAVISEYLSNLPVETLNTKTSYDTDNSLASTMLLSTTMSVSSHVSSVSIIDNGVESRAE